MSSSLAVGSAAGSTNAAIMAGSGVGKYLPMPRSAIQDLKGALSGELVTPSDPGFGAPALPNNLFIRNINLLELQSEKTG